MNKKIIIAHRGASGYLPEHTLACKAMAYAMEPDYIEQDIVLTKDDRAIVIHDRFLDTVSNVAELYPDKKRDDGRYYAIDFTLKEIQTLRIHERVHPGTHDPIYPNRFPETAITSFQIPTFEEEIEMIQGLNKSSGKNIGIYPELKGPAFHKREGKKIEEVVLGVLMKYGYTGRDSNCCVQCFEPDSIKYMRETLKSDLKMVQLVGDNTWEESPGVDYHHMLTPDGLDDVARYADAIGPWIGHIVCDMGKEQDPRITSLVKLAHERNLGIHAFTFRSDSMPMYAHSFDDMLDIFYIKMGIDGIFTDFPDKVADFLKRKHCR